MEQGRIAIRMERLSVKNLVFNSAYISAEDLSIGMIDKVEHFK